MDGRKSLDSRKNLNGRKYLDFNKLRHDQLGEVNTRQERRRSQDKKKFITRKAITKAQDVKRKPFH